MLIVVTTPNSHHFQPSMDPALLDTQVLVSEARAFDEAFIEDCFLADTDGEIEEFPSGDEQHQSLLCNLHCGSNLVPCLWFSCSVHQGF